MPSLPTPSRRALLAVVTASLVAVALVLGPVGGGLGPGGPASAQDAPVSTDVAPVGTDADDGTGAGGEDGEGDDIADAQAAADADLRGVWVIVAALGAVAAGLLVLLVLYVRATNPARAAARRAGREARAEERRAVKSARSTTADASGDVEVSDDSEDSDVSDATDDPDVSDDSDDRSGTGERVTVGATGRAGKVPAPASGARSDDQLAEELAEVLASRVEPDDVAGDEPRGRRRLKRRVAKGAAADGVDADDAAVGPDLDEVAETADTDGRPSAADEPDRGDADESDAPAGDGGRRVPVGVPPAPALAPVVFDDLDPSDETAEDDPVPPPAPGRAPATVLSRDPDPGDSEVKVIGSKPAAAAPRGPAMPRSGPAVDGGDTPIRILDGPPSERPPEPAERRRPSARRRRREEAGPPPGSGAVLDRGGPPDRTGDPGDPEDRPVPRALLDSPPPGRSPRRPRRVEAPAKRLGTPDAERVLLRPGQAPVRVPRSKGAGSDDDRGPSEPSSEARSEDQGESDGE